MAHGGQDSGLPASAVKQAGAGKPIAEKDGVLQIDADPTGQLAYVSKMANGTPGPVTFKMQNKSSVQHDLVVQGPASAARRRSLQRRHTGSSRRTLKPGTYTFFCSVDGHRGRRHAGQDRRK